MDAKIGQPVWFNQADTETVSVTTFKGVVVGNQIRTVDDATVNYTALAVANVTDTSIISVPNTQVFASEADALAARESIMPTPPPAP